MAPQGGPDSLWPCSLLWVYTLPTSCTVYIDRDNRGISWQAGHKLGSHLFHSNNSHTRHQMPSDDLDEEWGMATRSQKFPSNIWKQVCTAAPSQCMLPPTTALRTGEMGLDEKRDLVFAEISIGANIC